MATLADLMASMQGAPTAPAPVALAPRIPVDTSQIPVNLPTNLPKPKRSFGDVVGVVADALAIMGGQKPMYRTFQEQEAQRQRGRWRDNYFAQLQQNPEDESAAAQFVRLGGDIKDLAVLQKMNRPEVVTANGSVLSIDPRTSQVTSLYRAPSTTSEPKEVIIARMLADRNVSDRVKAGIREQLASSNPLANAGLAAVGGVVLRPGPEGQLTTVADFRQPDRPAPTTIFERRAEAIRQRLGEDAYNQFLATGKVPSAGAGSAPYSPTEVWARLQEAGKWLPKASSGGLQTLATAGARFFDLTPQSAEADSALDLIGAQLSTTAPRFQGPQSDKDVALYTKMAGNLMDSSKTSKERETARQTLMRLIFKYSGPGGTIRPGYKENMALPKEWRPPTGRPPLSSFVR